MRMHWSGRVVLAVIALLSTTACGAAYAQGRGYPNYPSPRGGIYRNADIAYDRGYQDGYERGRDAARDGDRYDPRREGWYRSADRGYNNRYGSRTNYRQSYRDAFVRGYERGFSETRYRDNGRYRRRW